MYLPFTTVLAAASTFADFKSYRVTRTMSNWTPPIPKPFLAVRQEAVAPPAPSNPVETSVVFLTSTTLLQPSATATVRSKTASHAQTSSNPQTSSVSTASPPAVTSSSLASSPPVMSTQSTQSVITIEITVSPSTLTSTITSALIPTLTSTLTPTLTSTPIQNTAPPSTSDSWASGGKIAGIVVGAVLGVIFLGMLVYTLYAVYRGVNVCNCCCGSDDDESRSMLPSRSSDTYPTAGSEPGRVYTRVARPVSSVLPPLRLMLPEQVAEGHRAYRLQRRAFPTAA